MMTIPGIIYLSTEVGFLLPTCLEVLDVFSPLTPSVQASRREV